MRLQLPSILIYSDLMIFDKARLGYLYYNSYSMREVSKKKEKIKQTFELVTGCVKAQKTFKVQCARCGGDK